MQSIKETLNKRLNQLKETFDLKWKYDKTFFIKASIIGIAILVAAASLIFAGSRNDKYQFDSNDDRIENISGGTNKDDGKNVQGGKQTGIDADGEYAYFTALETSGEAIEMIFVDVSGAVNSPGVVEIPEGSRVFQAIDSAGGLREDADTMKINLAAELRDGDKLFVPVIDTGAYSSDTHSDAIIGGGIVTAQVNQISASEGYLRGSDGIYNSNYGNNYSLININTATSSELETLSGIGPSTASKIIDYRDTHGGFSNVNELLNVSGIGEKTLAKFEDKICI